MLSPVWNFEIPIESLILFTFEKSQHLWTITKWNNNSQLFDFSFKQRLTLCVFHRFWYDNFDKVQVMTCKIFIEFASFALCATYQTSHTLLKIEFDIEHTWPMDMVFSLVLAIIRLSYVRDNVIWIILLRKSSAFLYKIDSVGH